VYRNAQGGLIVAHEYELTEEAANVLKQSNNTPDSQLQIQLTDEQMKAINP